MQDASNFFEDNRKKMNFLHEFYDGELMWSLQALLYFSVGLILMRKLFWLLSLRKALFNAASSNILNM